MESLRGTKYIIDNTWQLHILPSIIANNYMAIILPLFVWKNAKLFIYFCHYIQNINLCNINQVNYRI